MQRLPALALVLAMAAAAAAAEPPAALRLVPFEQADILKRCLVSPGIRATIEPKGRGNLALTFAPWREGGDEWPRIQFLNTVLAARDWSAYAALETTITNAGDTVDFLTLLVSVDKKQEWTMRCYVAPGATRVLRVPLSEVAAKVNLKDVRRVMFYMHKPAAERTFTVLSPRLLNADCVALQDDIDATRRTLERLALPPDDRHRRRLDEALEHLRGAAIGEVTPAQAASLRRAAALLRRQAEQLLYRAPLAFDFGSDDSPVRAGFQRVTPKTAYDRERGFGWTDDAARIASAVPATLKPTYSAYHRADVPPRVYYNDLTQDCVGGAAPTTFHVDLAAGEYEVWLLTGFSEKFPIHFVRCKVRFGDAPPRTVSIPQRWIFDTLTCPVSVADKGLNVSFAPETGWCADAMLVYPAADARRAHQEQIAEIEQEIYRLPESMWNSWERLTNPRPNPPLALTPADEQRGYVLFSRGYAHNVYPDSAPAADERLKELGGFATPGEYEPLTFSIYPLRALHAAEVRAGPLTGPAGAAIAADAFEVRTVRCWFTRIQYAQTLQYKQVPEMLLPAQALDLDPRACQRWWITVRAPQGTPAGVYRGEFELRFADAPAARVPVRLEVLPFRLLDDPTKSFGMYYYDPRAHISDRDSDAVKAAITERARRECVDMREHGMNTVQLSGVSLKTVVKKREYRIDCSALAANIAWYRSTGLLRDRPSMLGFWIVQQPYRDIVGTDWPKHLRDIPLGPPEYYAIVADLVRQMQIERQKHPDWPEFYYYPIDEAADEAAPFLARMLQAIRTVPGAKTYVTQIFERKSSRQLDGLVDVWCSGRFCTDEPALDRARAKGQIFWCYPNFIACARGVPNGARMTWGFAFWRSGYSCLIPWHYQAVCGNPFNDFDSRYGDWCVAYPGPDGPIPTQRWEAIREGIDDYRYIYTLERYLARAEKAGRGAALVKRGRDFLAELRGDIAVRESYVELPPGVALDKVGLWTFADYQSRRRALADLIIALGNEIGFGE